MEKYEDKVVPESVVKVLVETTCDICKKKIENERFGIDEVEISHEFGYVYPEGGSTVKAHVDMCGECFVGKLIPWLESQGCEMQIREIDI